ncbi:MAG: hypothetical protein V3U71_09540 [Cocleimonas sp.]
MNKILVALFCAFALTFMAQAKTVSMHNGGISFDAPASFVPMPPEYIKIKYPRGNVPANVLTSDSTETTIAFDLRAKDLPQSQIEATGKAFETAFKKVVGGFILKSNKTVQLAGQKWMQLEFISNTIDSEVYNIMLITGYKGQMLVFNLNSTLEEFKKYEPALRKSIKTIVLK